MSAFRVICKGKGAGDDVYAFSVVSTNTTELIKSSEMRMMKFLVKVVMSAPFLR